jgi:hypothetical protein
MVEHELVAVAIDDDVHRQIAERIVLLVMIILAISEVLSA